MEMSNKPHRSLPCSLPPNEPSQAPVPPLQLPQPLYQGLLYIWSQSSATVIRAILRQICNI